MNKEYSILRYNLPKEKQAFKFKAIDAPDYIVAMRTKLKLSQNQARQVFMSGGNTNTFYTYEKGISKPPKSLLVMLQFIEKHPEHWEEIKEIGILTE